MIDPDTLNVWNEQRLVGYLWRNPIGYISFRYDPVWIEARGFSTSRTLPLSTNDFAAEDSIAHLLLRQLTSRRRHAGAHRSQSQDPKYGF